MLLPGNYGFPTLRHFAVSQLVRHLDQISPSLISDLMVRSSRLERRYKAVAEGHKKLVRRLIGRKNRAQQALHEMRYVACKISEIVHVLTQDATVISNRDLHYARSELTTLNDLQLGQTVIQQYLDICEVIFSKVINKTSSTRSSSFLSLYDLSAKV